MKLQAVSVWKKEIAFFVSVWLVLSVFLLSLSSCGSSSDGQDETGSGEKPGSDSGVKTEEQTEEQTEPEPDFSELLHGCTELVLASRDDTYLDARADEFLSVLEQNWDLTLRKVYSRVRRSGTKFYFGFLAPSDKSDPAELGTEGYAVYAEGESLYLTLGSAYAARKFISDTEETIRNEVRLEMPVVSKDTSKGTFVLKVGSFNIHNGQDVGHDFSVLADDLIAAGLDVVGLQEVDYNTTRNKQQDTLSILAEKAGYPYSYYTRCIDLQGGYYGTAILSKYPIRFEETIELPGTGEQRCYGHVELNVNGTSVDFFNTHLAWPSAADRAKQNPVLASAVSECDIAIVTGDMNSDGLSEYGHLYPDFSFANGDKGDDRYFVTNEEDGAIDNVLASPAFDLLESGIIDTAHSDHCMIWALLLYRG